MNVVIKRGRPLAENPKWLQYVPKWELPRIMEIRELLKHALNVGDAESVARYRTALDNAEYMARLLKAKEKRKQEKQK